MGKYPCPFPICLSCFLCRKLQILLCCIHQLGQGGVTLCRRVWPVYWFCTLSLQGRGIGPGCDPYCPHTFPKTWPLVPCFHRTCFSRPIALGKSFLQARGRGYCLFKGRYPLPNYGHWLLGLSAPRCSLSAPYSFDKSHILNYLQKWSKLFYKVVHVQWIPSFSQNRGKINMILKLLPPL